MNGAPPNPDALFILAAVMLLALFGVPIIIRIRGRKAKKVKKK